MQQMLQLIPAGVFILLCAIEDYRSQRVTTGCCLAFGMGGLMMRIANMAADQSFSSAYSYVPGIVLSCILLMLGKVTEEQIGYGDGLCLLVLSFYLNWKQITGVFLAAIFISSLYGMVLFVRSQGSRKERFPFLPFLLIGFSGQMLGLLS